MAVLNLRDEEPVSESDDEITLPETPPGLDAIRIWLRKPRPWLHGLRLWIAQIGTWILQACRFFRRNAGPAAEQLRRIAKKGAPLARATVRVGHAVRGLGVRTSAAAHAFRDPDRGSTKTGERLDAAGQFARRSGERITAGAGVAEKVLSTLGVLGEAFRPARSPELDLRGSDHAADTPGPAVSRPGRTLPPAEREALPESRDDPGPDGGPRRAASDGHPADPAPASQPVQSRPNRGPAPDPRATPHPPEEPDPRLAPDPAPMPRPDPEISRRPPSSVAASPTPRPDPETDREQRLEGLPKVLRPHVLALSERPRRDVLRHLILEICRRREWTTAAELARWLSMHQPSLVARHLSPLVDAGLLELRVPDSPKSRRQAYRTDPDALPPP